VDGQQLEDRLQVWERAGILTPDQRARIRAFEADPRAARREAIEPQAPQSSARGSEERRGRVSEIVGYVGAAFALGAVVLLFEQIWDRFEPWAQITLVLLLAITAIAAGAATLRRPGLPLRRLTAVLWLAGVAAVGWAAGLIGSNGLGLREERLALLVGLAIAVIAAVLLWIGQHAVLQLGVAIGLIVAVVAGVTLVSPLQPAPSTYGVLLIGGGVAWALAGAGGWLGPVRTAEVTGAVLALIGSQALATGDRRVVGLAVGLTLATLVVGSSLVGERPHLLLVGAAGLFILVPQLVFELFADTIGAPATLLTVGILLILLAVGLGRARSSQDRDGERAPTAPVAPVRSDPGGDAHG